MSRMHSGKRDARCELDPFLFRRPAFEQDADRRATPIMSSIRSHLRMIAMRVVNSTPREPEAVANSTFNLGPVSSHHDLIVWCLIQRSMMCHDAAAERADDTSKPRFAPRAVSLREMVVPMRTCKAVHIISGRRTTDALGIAHALHAVCKLPLAGRRGLGTRQATEATD